MLRMAFYKKVKGAPVNALIAGWTWLSNIKTPPYSHAEIGLLLGGKWTYYSSTNRDGAKGCRWIKEENLFKNPGNWDVYEFEEGRPIEFIIADLNSTLGSKYDWWGIAGFATPFGLVNSKKKWYCSEVCYYGLIGKWKKRISPRRLFSFIRANFKTRMVRHDDLVQEDFFGLEDSANKEYSAGKEIKVGI